LSLDVLVGADGTNSGASRRSLMVRSGGEGAPELGEDGINSAARGLKVLAVRAMPFEGATREEGALKFSDRPNNGIMSYLLSAGGYFIARRLGKSGRSTPTYVTVLS
jgi:hypothetical protein